jgi:hypothetical protein
MQHLVNLGAPRHKLLVGIPFYGQSFTLQSKTNNEPGAPSGGPGRPGKFTNQPGMLAYYEICDGGKPLETSEHFIAQTPHVRVILFPYNIIVFLRINTLIHLNANVLESKRTSNPSKDKFTFICHHCQHNFFSTLQKANCTHTKFRNIRKFCISFTSKLIEKPEKYYLLLISGS